MIEPLVQGPAATSDALAGSDWEILTVDGIAVSASPPVRLAFGHDGRVSGTTGINHLTASYSVTADYVTFGPLATSRHPGSSDQLDQEHRVVASFAGMCPFRLTTRTLEIEGPLGLVSLVRTNEPASPPPRPDTRESRGTSRRGQRSLAG